MKLYRLRMEGDFGQEDMIFISEDEAKAWAEKAYRDQIGEDTEDWTFEGFWEDLCVVEPYGLSDGVQRWVASAEDNSEWRSRLEAAGVDNWDGYAFAFEDYEEDDEE